MKKLHSAVVKKTIVNGNVVYFCVTGQKSALFYNREHAQEWVRSQCIVC